MRKRIIKQLAFAALAGGLVMNAFAVAEGFYMGVELGPATNAASNQQAQVEGPPTVPPTTVTVTPKSQQFGSRFILGYMIYPWVGYEFAGTFFSDISYDSKGVETCGSTTSRVRDLELMLKGSIPIQQFSLFGRIGPAFTYQTNGGALNPTTTAECGKSTNLTKFAPAYSIGAEYGLSQNWVADLVIHTVAVGGKVGSMTMFGVGISYHFVDVYCGQFLC